MTEEDPLAAARGIFNSFIFGVILLVIIIGICYLKGCL